MDAVRAIDQMLAEPALQVRRFSEIDPSGIAEDAINPAGTRGVAGDVREVEAIEVGVLPGHPATWVKNRAHL
jgi:hypothetical protein